MSAIGYLLRTQVKNYIKQLLKKPAALVMYIIFIAFMAFTLIMSMSNNISTDMAAKWMQGPAGAALGAITLLFPLFKGVSEGGTLFSMADVNIMFPSPVSPKRILVYGILNQMAMTLLIAFILLFQVSNLRMWLGMEPGGAIIAIVVAIVCIYTINVASMLVYALCSSKPSRRNGFKLAGRAGTAAIAVLVVYAFVQERNAQAAAGMVMSNKLVSLFPVVGWTKSIFESADAGGVALLLPLAGILLFAATVTIALMTVSTDFYEDVLAATEKRQSAVEDKRAGKMQEITLFKRGLRLRMRGRGANTIFFRQLSEYARRGFFDVMTITLVLTTLITRIAMSAAADVFDVDRFMIIMMAYMMMFFNMQGLLGRDLQKPFIYLIPARPFLKLVYASILTPFKAFMDGALLAVILAAFFKMPFMYIPVYAFSAAGFSAVYTAGDILSRVILGDSRTRTVTMLIYIALSVVLAVPGGAMLLVFDQLWLGCIVCSVWCFGGAAIIAAACSKSVFEFQAGA